MHPLSNPVWWVRQDSPRFSPSTQACLTLGTISLKTVLACVIGSHPVGADTSGGSRTLLAGLSKLKPWRKVFTQVPNKFT